MVDDSYLSSAEYKPDRSVLFQKITEIAIPILAGLTVYVAAHDPASIYANLENGAWGGGWITPGLALINLILWLILVPAAVRRSAMLGLSRIPAAAALAGAFFVFYGFGYRSAVHAPVTLWIQMVAACLATALLSYFLFTTGASARPILRGITLGGAALCVEALIHLFSRVETPHQLIALTGNRAASGDPNLANRLGNGMLPYPTLLVSLLLIFASIALGLAVVEKRWQNRLLAVAAYCLNAVCMWLTASRGGVILLALLSLSHLAFSAAEPRKYPSFNKMLAAGAAAAIAIISLFVLKLGLTRGSVLRADGSLASRVHMWRVCWRIFKENPITGGGPGAFLEAWIPYSRKVHYPAYVVPHSLYFGMLS